MALSAGLTSLVMLGVLSLLAFGFVLWVMKGPTSD